ncbi:MAG: efflux RND transporter periplasmic adaptor subunit [Bacteroidales bacterium]|nr:efflux RND transporter periplasmic adaptor subunit [Bacteroidales bacterium]
MVKVQPALKKNMAAFIEITGTIQANIYTDLLSPADGIIETLTARENQWVAKDKVIAVINPNERVSLISNNQLQVDLLEKRLAEADAEGEKELLLLELEKAKSNLDYAEKMYQVIPVVCPMSGLVTQRYTDKGSQVSAKDKIITISDMNSLVIKAEVNEKYFEAIQQGKRLPLMLNAYPNDSLQGVISLVYPQVDALTRSVKFDIKISGFKKRLLPGMMASIKIPVSLNQDAISVPEQAVLTSPDNQSFIFVADKDSIVHRRVVETGMSPGNDLEIVSGLQEQENVVVQGQEMLKDGVKVKFSN